MMAFTIMMIGFFLLPYTLKFIYSEKAKKFWEISTLLLSVLTVDKNCVVFSDYTNFNIAILLNLIQIYFGMY